MNAIEAIKTRISVRKFSDQSISDEDLHTILEAGMSGPSAVNARPWTFIVVRDKEMLAAMADGNGSAANPLRGADAGILICGDLSRAYKGAPDYWVIDAAIAAQNMSLAAHALGLGSVWLGTWPQENKVAAQKALFNLPDGIVPHSIIAFGHPEAPSTKVKTIWEDDRVHWENW